MAEAKLTFELETIDREKAQQYIGKNVGNRPVSQGHLNQLIGRQRRGEWRTNGDSIRFDWNGDLRDGQHRLHMVMLTGIPIEAVVMRGIDPGAFVTMDTGKTRSITDVLGIKKETSPKLLAAAVQWTYRYLADRMTGKIESHEVLLSVLDQHPELRDTVEWYQAINQPRGAPGYPAITLGAHYLFSRVNKSEADDFIDRYLTGLRVQQGSDPVGILRGQVVSLASPQARILQPSQIFGLFVLAWNIQHSGKRIPKRGFSIPPRGAPRAKIIGFPEGWFIDGQLAFPVEDDDEEIDV